MPAPESVDELSAADRIDEDRGGTKRPARRTARSKARNADEKETPAPKKRGRPRKTEKRAENEEYFDDDDDDSLFADTRGAAGRKTGASGKARSKKPFQDDFEDESARPARKSRLFGKGEDDGGDRAPFKKRQRHPFVAARDEDENERNNTRRAGRNDYSVDEDERGRRAFRFEASDADDDDEDDFSGGDATIVDADWEDVNEYGRPRGFGRRVRAERRRETALARVEDVGRFNSSLFDEEFFASLHVTPKELERAIRKARRRAEAREKNRLTPWRAFGWSAWFAAVAGALYAVVVYRDQIVQIAPSTADAYAVVGIETRPFGLAIENVRHRLAMSTGGPMIEITGELRNDGDAQISAPLLQAEALGPRGALLSRWTFSPSETEVGAGSAISFVTRAPAPDGVSEVALSFAPVTSVLDPGSNRN